MRRDALTGRVAVVTGSGRRSGIGYSVVKRLARHGVSTVVSDICCQREASGAYLREEMESIVGELRGVGGQHIAVEADVTDPVQVESLFDRAEEMLGSVDILVNNAGICVLRPLLETTVGEWETLMKVNAFGTFLCSTVAARRMIRRGIGGRIVNISSISGKEGWPGFGAYTASKFAVLGFTQTFAREMASHNISVNAVCPGLVATGLNDELVMQMAKMNGVTCAEINEAQLGRVPMGRYGTPQDVAEAVLFLASPMSSYITGQALNVSGGLMVCR